jgi:glutathione S-transferase
MTEPILHHYPVSPFAEKVRAMLGFKGLAWKSVQIPLILPKPDLVALTGGYRKTPVLQIGADIYCDTSLIARVLERLAPAPSLFPQGDTLALQAAAHFADNTVFGITIPIAFQPGSGMMKAYFSDATPEYLASFGKDRAAMRRGGTVRRGPLHECKANLPGLLAKIEAQLKAPYLFGDQACVADFALYHARALSQDAEIRRAHGRVRARQIGRDQQRRCAPDRKRIAARARHRRNRLRNRRHQSRRAGAGHAGG